ncbi:hypothetical protein [Mocis latipes granulovirus]|uniref:Uncharacterized protein n=1 Tax=Mocis latipes granulovirus TaxID=2072024 RepID=A0A162GWX8_9BBAC|nr:hypothetical protein [Mocis latipes granulovirus]AKR17520.1 hypothetical protein [Mocis latipes granulovirus]
MRERIQLYSCDDYNVLFETRNSLIKNAQITVEELDLLVIQQHNKDRISKNLVTADDIVKVCHSMKKCKRKLKF